MQEEKPTFVIPDSVIKPIIEAHVGTAIMAALGGSGAIIDKAVIAALSARVDGQGRQSGYSSDIPIVTYMVKESIQQVAKKTILEWAEKNAAAIEATILKELSSKKNPLLKAFAQRIASNFVDSAKLKYRFHIAVDE